MEYKTGLLASVILPIITTICSWIRKYYLLLQTKKKIAARKLQSHERTRRIQQRMGATSAEEFDPHITELSFSELQEKLQNGHLTARKVLFAYQHKAFSVNNELNCIADFIEGAEDRAGYLDTLKPHERKPLHGIPISLKDSIGVQGMDSTCGVTKFVDKIAENDGLLLKVLIDQGAVPFVKTNVSQAQMSVSCSNPIFGTTKNPFDLSKTPGGSSGGEGALISAGGSILGVACDNDGSIRIPCHFCGVYGLKPSANRISASGNFPVVLGTSACPDVYGPMGRDVDSLVSMMTAALTPAMFNLDPLIPQLPWREEIYASKVPLTIGYYDDDGCLEPMPAVKRAVMESRDVLYKMGHKMVEFSPPDVLRAFRELFFPIILGDGGKKIKKILENDVVEKSTEDLLKVVKLPQRVRMVLLLAIKCMKTLHPVEESIYAVKAPKSVSNWWDLHEKIEEYKRRFITEVQRADIDVLLFPAFPFTAFPIDDESGAKAGLTYTVLYNLLNFPCGVVPVTTVSSQDSVLMAQYPRSNDFEKYVHKVATDSVGLPVAVQLASLPFQEETVLRAMKDLETGLK